MRARSLEQKLPADQQLQALRSLLGRVSNLEAQILQLRSEIRDGFSDMRAAMRAGGEPSCDAALVARHELKANGELS